jgi:twinkle protein
LRESDGASADVSNSESLALRDILESVGILMNHYPAGTHRLVCPRCSGGSDGEPSLSLTIRPDGDEAVWHCFRASCGWADSSTGLLKRHGSSRLLQTHPLLSPAGNTPASPPYSNASSRHTRSDQRRLQQQKHMKGLSVPFEEEIEDIGDDENIRRYFERERHISLSTVRNAGVGKMSPVKPPHGQSENRKAIVFPYRRDGKIVNAKFRCGDKTMWQSKGGEKVLFGLDDIKESERVIVVEGEIDKLSLDEAGIHNAVSVPDGAPPPVSSKPTSTPQRQSGHVHQEFNNKDGKAENKNSLGQSSDELGEDKKFSYLHNCRAHLDKAKEIVLAVDGDEAGRRVAEELARRLGKERCYKVQWPESCKDANDVLTMEDGCRQLQAVIADATPWPIRGLHTFNDYWSELLHYWQMGSHQEDVGMSTGWESLDQLYKVVPGELSVVTGIPNSGKSEWLDALVMNLARQHNWIFALCSLENKVHEHGRKLLEKFVGRPFFQLSQHGSSGQSFRRVQRMQEHELRRGFDWISQRFVLIRHDDDQLPSIDYVLEVSRVAVMRYGIRGLVIDPYNELDHRRPQQMSETEYVSQMLSKLQRFASLHGVHVWLVAHPRQLHQYKGDPPGLYDISGSAHFMNKADAGLVVHRNNQEEEGGRSDVVNVYVRKMRNKIAGEQGFVQLRYDRASGKYCDDVNNGG